MSRKSRMQSAREAKDKRTKKVAAGLAVVLVAVLAFEVPKVLHKSSPTATPPAATTTATDATVTTATGVPATTVPGTAAAALTPTASTKLPNSDVQPRGSKSSLYSFNHFSGKDPFIQQVSAATTGVQTAAPAQKAQICKADPQSPSCSFQGTPGVSCPASPQESKAQCEQSGALTAATHNQSSRLLAATGSARISINGQIQTVRVGASFPSANPLFRLVAVANGLARIGIANGSYSSGAHTISLSPGRSLTLVDTADGVRYRIRLIAAS